MQTFIVVTWLWNAIILFPPASFPYPPMVTTLQCAPERYTTQSKTLEINARTNKQHWRMMKSIFMCYSSTLINYIGMRCPHCDSKMSHSQTVTALPQLSLFGWNLNQEVEKRITSQAVPLSHCKSGIPSRCCCHTSSISYTFSSAPSSPLLTS